jgi:hypothetical protein
LQKIIILLAMISVFVMIAPSFASQHVASGYPDLWFVSWPPISPVTGNYSQGFGGFRWADSHASMISIRIDWGDGSTDSLSASGTLDTSLQPPSYTAFADPQHVYTIAGTFTLHVTLSDIVGSTVTHACLVTVIQGPLTLHGVYGAGGRSPVKM